MENYVMSDPNVLSILEYIEQAFDYEYDQLTMIMSDSNSQTTIKNSISEIYDGSDENSKDYESNLKKHMNEITLSDENTKGMADEDDDLDVLLYTFDFIDTK